MKTTIELRINNQVVDQAPDQKGSFERLNPYLTYEASAFFTDRANVPTLPDTPTNRGIFGFVDIPSLGSDVPRFSFQQYINGYLVFEGLALLTDYTPKKGYSLTIVQPVGEFFGQYQTQKLTDIDFGTVSLPTPLAAAGVVQSGAQDAVCFPTILNQDFYGDKGASISYTNRVNDYASGAYTTSGPRVPLVFLKYLLRRIAQLAGVTVQGAFMNDTDTDALVLYNIRALDGVTSVTLNRHLPELTVVDLLVELRKYLNLSFTFDTLNKTLSLGYTDTIFAQPTMTDWSDKLVVGARKILERNRRLQLTMELDSNDAIVKDRPTALADYLTATFADDLAIAKLSTKFSTLMVDNTTGLANARQLGATSQFAQLDKKSTPRLLFWQGVQSGFPRALPTNVTGTKSLYWNGTTGIFNWLWAKTEAFRRQIHYLDCKLLLSEADLATLDMTRKVHINGVNYLPVRIANSYPLTEASSALLVSV